MVLQTSGALSLSQAKAEMFVGDTPVNKYNYYNRMSLVQASGTDAPQVQNANPDVAIRMANGVSWCVNQLYMSQRVQDWSSFTLTFDVYSWSATADGMGVFFGCTAPPSTGTVEQGGNGGMNFCFQVYSGGGNPQGIQLYDYTSTQVVADTTTAWIGTSTWNTVVISYTRGTINTWSISMNGTTLYTYTDTGNPGWLSSSGPYWGFVVRQGGANMGLTLRHVSMTSTAAPSQKLVNPCSWYTAMTLAPAVGSWINPSNGYYLAMSGADPDIQYQMNQYVYYNTSNTIYHQTRVQSYASFTMSFQVNNQTTTGGSFTMFFGATSIDDTASCHPNGWSIVFNITTGSTGVYTSGRGIYLINSAGTVVSYVAVTGAGPPPTLASMSVATYINSNVWQDVVVTYTRSATATWVVQFCGTDVLVYDDASNTDWVNSANSLTSGAYWGVNCKTGATSCQTWIRRLQLSYTPQTISMSDIANVTNGMSAAGPVSFSSLYGKQVQATTSLTTLAKDLGVYNMWGGAAFPDQAARWIWNVAGANTSAPGAVYIQFQSSYTNPTNMNITATMYVCCDNQAFVYQNKCPVESTIFQGAWSGTSCSLILVPGSNVFDFVCVNGGPGANPAGLIYSLMLNTIPARYPPASLSAAGTGSTGGSATLAGQIWGNGTYVISASASQDATHVPMTSFDFNTTSTNGWGSGKNYSQAAGGAYIGATSTTIGGTAYLGDWIQLQLPAATVIYYLTALESGSSNVLSLVIAGSTDGSTWTLLYLNANLPAQPANTLNTFTFTNPGSYQYYRFIVRATNPVLSGGFYGFLIELALYGPSTALPRLPPVSLASIGTSFYGNAVVSTSPYGNGCYYIAGTSQLSTTYCTANAFNMSSTDYWSPAAAYSTSTGAYTGSTSTTVSGTSQSGEYLQINLPYPVAVTYATVTEPAGQNATSLVIAASLDGVTWYSLYAATGIAKSTTITTASYTLPGTTAYTIYRYIIRAIGASVAAGTPGVSEFYFSGPVPLMNSGNSGAAWSSIGPVQTYPMNTMRTTVVQTSVDPIIINTLPIMDKIAPATKAGCTAAYSLKRLSMAYTGPTVNLRRSTDNATADFYADIAGNLGQSVNATGTSFANWRIAGVAYVTKWYDQSGNGSHAWQTTTASQPSLTMVSGNLNLVDFLNTSACWLTMSNSPVPTGTAGARYAFVVRHGAINNVTTGTFIGAGGQAQSIANVLRCSTSAGYMNYWWNNDIYIPSATGVVLDNNTVVSMYDGTTRSAWVNSISASTTTTATGTTAAGTQYLGRSPAGEYLNGQMYDAYIFNSNIPESDRILLSPTFAIPTRSFVTPPITAGLIGNYSGETFAGSTWTDLTGITGNATSTGTIGTSSMNGFIYLTGAAATSTMTWPGAQAVPWTGTLFHVCKYNGSTRGRILATTAASGNNTLSGFWSGCSGVAYGDNNASWETAAVNHFTAQTWVVSCHTHVFNTSACYRGNGTDFTTGFGWGGRTLAINGSGETSDWAMAALLIYNTDMTTAQKVLVENWLFEKYNIVSSPV